MQTRFIKATLVILGIAAVLTFLGSFTQGRFSAEASATTDVVENFDIPVYRFWNRLNYSHFFTAKDVEKAYLLTGVGQQVWKYENIAYFVAGGDCANPGEVEVHRFYSQLYSRHFFTAIEAERNFIQSNYPATVWAYDGVAFCAADNNTGDYTGLKPVYRFWNELRAGHFFTASNAEKLALQHSYPGNGWRYEGVAFYVNTQNIGLLVDPVSPNCPVSTQNCVPCVSGDQYCRIEAGKQSGFKGWACQNNNPGNIRYSDFRNSLIAGQGVENACGQRNGYMVFRDYHIGREALKSYVRAIDQGLHSSYTPCGNCSIRFFFSKYAPAGDQNNPTSYSNNVANYLGVNVDSTTISWVVQNRLDDFVVAIQIQEGWFTQ